MVETIFRIVGVICCVDVIVDSETRKKDYVSNEKKRKRLSRGRYALGCLLSLNRK